MLVANFYSIFLLVCSSLAEFKAQSLKSTNTKSESHKRRPRTTSTNTILVIPLTPSASAPPPKSQGPFGPDFFYIFSWLKSISSQNMHFKPPLQIFNFYYILLFLARNLREMFFDYHLRFARKIPTSSPSVPIRTVPHRVAMLYLVAKLTIFHLLNI